jgi:hypothetical protein
MPKKYTSRVLNESINVRLPAEDMKTLRAICVRLDLERSEVARRCVKEGLKTFRGVKLPGADHADEQTV